MGCINFRDLLYYSADSPSRLKWSVDLYSGEYSTNQLTYRGGDAGYLHSLGYWVVTYKGKKYRAHRIIWEINFGDIPDGLVIDHKDGNPSNNDLDNLRAVPASWNSQNRKKDPRNKSGKTGVFKRTHKGIDYWVAFWVDSAGVVKQKNYSCNKYGDTQAEILATNFREDMIDKLNALGADYTDRHRSGGEV